MSTALKILIVEDEEPMALLIERIVKPLMGHFPGSQVIFAHSMKIALEIIATFPAPSVALLDLRLPDSDIDQTIAKLDAFEDRCPVVIVTGYAEGQVRTLLEGRNIGMITKDDALSQPGMLLRMITWAAERWHAGRYERVLRDINRMKEIVKNATAYSLEN